MEEKKPKQNPSAASQLMFLMYLNVNMQMLAQACMFLCQNAIFNTYSVCSVILTETEGAHWKLNQVSEVFLIFCIALQARDYEGIIRMCYLYFT